MGSGNQWKVGTSVVGVRTSGRWEPVKAGTSGRWEPVCVGGVRTSGRWVPVGGGNQWEMRTKGVFSQAGWERLKKEPVPVIKENTQSTPQYL